MRIALLAVTLFVGCFSPKPQAGSACAPDGTCPAPLVCEPASNTCEDVFQDASTGNHNEALPIDAPPDMMLDAKPDARQIDGCAPTQEICGDSIDQDCDLVDPPCAVNDHPNGAIDVTAGGAFSGDALLATNDGDGPCNPNSGPDLFYDVNLAAPEAFYFDTFNSTYDTAIHIFAGECSADGLDLACQEDSCGGMQTQVVAELPAGKSCIVVDGKPGQTTGTLALHVIPAGRAAEGPLTPGTTISGTTCNSTNVEDPIDQCDEPGMGGKDLAYWITQCPGQSQDLDADTCSMTTDYDSVLYVRRVGGNQLDCNDDDNTCAPNDGASSMSNVDLVGGHFYLLIVDGYNPMECGNFRLHSSLQ